MKFVEATAEHAGPFADFLHRMGADARLGSLPFGYYGPSPDIKVSRWLLLDDAKTRPVVVGSVSVKRQVYLVGDQLREIAALVYPVTLGVAEPRYAMAAPMLFRHSDTTFPLNYLLGMGAPETNPTAKLSQLLGWTLTPAPYLFLPLRLGPLLAMRLSRRPILAGSAAIAANAGLFAPVDFALRRIARAAAPAPSLQLRSVASFDHQIDDLWRLRRAELGFSLVRDSRQLNALFPAAERFERWLMTRGAQVVGYAVLLTPPIGAARFSNARVATLVDFSVLQADIDDGVALLVREFARRPLDAVLFNGAEAAALASLATHGFRARPTGVYLATSRRLQTLLDEAKVGVGRMLLTRADGDGPIGLGVDLQ
jgi:hypothetical protein